MEILPRRGPSCFPTFVNKLRRDYSWLASKLDTEYKKAQKEVSKDINNKLIDVINQQLTPLVYGDVESRSLSPQVHPGYLVHQLSDTVNTLQYRSYRALGISSKDSATSYLSLPQLIEGKVQSLQNSLSEMKTLLSEEKKKNKTSVAADKKLEKEITKLKKELDKQKDTNKKLETYKKQEASIKSKNKQIQSLLRENAALVSANQELQKEMCVYHRGAMITEWKM